MARLLGPGGRFYLFEENPLTYLFDEEAPAYVHNGRDYFSREVELSRGWTPAYIGDLGKADDELALKYECQWSAPELISHLADAGPRLFPQAVQAPARGDRCPLPAHVLRVVREASGLSAHTTPWRAASISATHVLR